MFHFCQLASVLCCLILLSVSSIPREVAAADPELGLNDFDWKATDVRFEAAITRHKLSSSLLYGFDYEEYKPEHGVTVVTVRLTAKNSGNVRLVADLFFLDTDFYALCEGLKILEPVLQPVAKGFSPRQGGNGRTSFRVAKGQTLVLELAFEGKLTRNYRLLAALPVVTIPNVPSSK